MAEEPTRNHEDQAFLKDVVHDVFGSDFLVAVIEWIGDRLDPEQVFDSQYLNDWAKRNKGRLDAIPEDLFDRSDLEDWAHENGWAKLD